MTLKFYVRLILICLSFYPTLIATMFGLGGIASGHFLGLCFLSCTVVWFKFVVGTFKELKNEN